MPDRFSQTLYGPRGKKVRVYSTKALSKYRAQGWTARPDRLGGKRGKKKAKTEAVKLVVTTRGLEPEPTWREWLYKNGQAGVSLAGVNVLADVAAAQMLGIDIPTDQLAESAILGAGIGAAMDPVIGGIARAYVRRREAQNAQKAARKGKPGSRRAPVKKKR